jgi:hypothetical protein
MRLALPGFLICQATSPNSFPGARRDRLSRAERIRERTLLEVLTEAMRR